ncbi:hypothetical protein [uncultured Ruegeria sp.]|uniref:hypothetical protein n=1 Tax=uncultured Ruegeria sp. TaxID=259304 RepID=UPI00261F4B40|nr:hypothetical protein [uncultured Ruegeria sp.]
MRLLLSTALAALLAWPAFAQNCAPRDEVITRLAENYGESRQGIGIARQGAVMEIFASNNTGTWTITATLPNGLTCLIASGQSYESLNEAIIEGDPA